MLIEFLKLAIVAVKAIGLIVGAALLIGFVCLVDREHAFSVKGEKTDKISILEVCMIVLAVICWVMALPLSLLADLILGPGFFGLFWTKERLTH